MYINPELYIFEGLTSDEVNYFALMCEPIDYDSGEIIMTEGSKSDGRAFFIESGVVEVLRNGKVVAKLTV
jgi:CRP-like cAMP-binding protein